MEKMNIYMIGVGGQGIGLLSESLIRAADYAGLNVRGVDTHGLAQRGGTVQSHLRIGEGIYSSLIQKGKADLVIALERNEALRGLETYVKDSGKLVYYDTSWQPLDIRLGEGKEVKNSDIKEKAKTKNVENIRVFKEDLEDSRMQNVVILAEIAKRELISEIGIDNYKSALNDYKRNLERFNNTKATTNSSKSAVSVYAGRVDVNNKSEAVEWVKGLGLYGQKATNKELPDFVFQLNKRQVGLLLAKMFQGDGCINLKRKYPQIFYSTSSKVLARQMQHLFLKLGIIATLHKKKFKYKGGHKTGYTLTINRFTNIKKFYENCYSYLVKGKAKNLKTATLEHSILNGKVKKGAARGSKDIIPSLARTM